MDLKKEIDILYRSRHTLICMISREEERIIKETTHYCQEKNRQLYLWDHGDSFKGLVNAQPVASKATDPLSALEAIAKLPDPSIIILRDFHQCWKNQPRVIRKLRNLAQEFKFTKKSILAIMPVEDIPVELKDEATVMTLPPPDINQLNIILQELATAPNVKFQLDSPEKESFLRSALGLSTNQAQRIFARAIVSGGKLEAKDRSLIIQYKKEIIKESGALEFFTTNETPDNVGGLDILKDWLKTRRFAFSEEAQRYGLPSPKGIALIGIPGSGKSLTAKMIGALWGLPLIRLDIGSLYGSLVGQSEANVRQALAISEAIAPCVLWIDEIEKGLAGGDFDGGTSSRVFGTILSWMQEKTKPVFMVATANNIAALPPELLRRGRFDEVFFLDLPNLVERKAIFYVHIRKRGRDPKNFNLSRLAAVSDGYVGAEIEQAVIDAMYTAFSDRNRPGREFNTQDILDALNRLVPLSRSQKENIDMLRSWLKEGRARSASSRDLPDNGSKIVNIEIDPLRSQ